MQSRRVNQRLNVLAGHLRQDNAEAALQASVTSAAGTKNPDDIVIVKAIRTPVGKAKRGAFKSTGPDALLVPVLKHLVTSTPQIKPEQYGDVVIGTVLPPGAQGATEVRVASLLAGLPDVVPVTTVNRQCSSGLQAIANVAASIKAGYYEVGIAGGVESMSSNSMDRWDGGINQEALQHQSAKGCYISMGQTSENVAEKYGISREKQDQFAALSHKKAAEAIKAGKFRDEIVPVTVTVEDDKGNSTTVTVTEDEGVRADTTAEKLGKLRAAFKQGGSTTAGNSSQVSDGAAAVIVTKRSVAQKLGLPIMGVFRSFAAVGVDPSVMGIGPAVAIPAALKLAGVNIQDVDVFEINEAFASQAVYCVEKLGIPIEKVNPNGGAIALGHPLGCTGARQTTSILNELKRRGARFGVVSMCIGSGMGAAAVYEREN